MGRRASPGRRRRVTKPWPSTSAKPSMPAVSPSATASSAAPGTYCHGLPAPPRIRVDTATRRTMPLLDAPSWDRGAHRRRRRDEQHRSMNPADLLARHATQVPLTSPRSRRELAASRPCHRVGRCPTPRQDCVGQRAASCAPSRPPAAKAQRAGSMAARSLAQGCVGQGDQRSIIASINPVDTPWECHETARTPRTFSPNGAKIRNMRWR